MQKPTISSRPTGEETTCHRFLLYRPPSNYIKNRTRPLRLKKRKAGATSRCFFNTTEVFFPWNHTRRQIPLAGESIFVLVEVCIPSWLSMTSVNTCDFGDNYFTMKGDKIPHPLITLIITQISLSKNLFILAKVQRRWLIAKFSTSFLATSQENRTFVATDSATLPIEQRTRAELLLFIGL